MKIKWLLEPEVFQHDSDIFLKKIKEMGVEHTICKFGVPYECYIRDLMLQEGHVIFHGSLQFAKLLKKTIATVYCTLPKYECLYYYPRFGSDLLNADYAMLPFGELARRKNWAYNISASDPLFIRPSSGYKNFTGMLVEKNSWDREIKALSRFIDPEALVVIAPHIGLLREWRAVVVNNKIITASQYKDNGVFVRKAEVPEKVIAYGQELLERIKYRPDPAWTLDICETEAGGLKVVEVGSFSCSGFYACDPEVIINSINSLVEGEH